MSPALFIRSGQAQQRGEEWNVAADRSYADFQAMAVTEAARADGIDAVMITTPNHAHFAAAAAFLEAGIDVICDKPLTNFLAEAEQLERLAGDKGLVFAVCYTMSRYPMIRQGAKLRAQASWAGSTRSMSNSCRTG